MALIRKTRFPSALYLEYKIAEMGKIANLTQEEIVLLAQYKKMLGQRINNERNS